MCLGIALGLRLDKIDEAHVFGAHVRRRLPGGPDVGGGDGRGPLRRLATSPRSSTTTTSRPTARPRRSWTSRTCARSSRRSSGTRSRSTATTWPQIVEALEWSRTRERPAAIVCQTKKGRGVSLMEDQFGFHGKPPTPEQAEQALTELEAKLAEQTRALGTRATSDDADARRTRSRRARPTATRWSSWASSTTRSSRSTPTSRSRRRASSSASASPSASSTSARPRPT